VSTYRSCAARGRPQLSGARAAAGSAQRRGTPALSVTTWFVSADELGDGIVYLQKADDPGSAVLQEIGEVGGRRLTAQEGGR
jgi:predicted short-subunit dehydrogenase-like oxidoreductase (DUF2520 family)